MKLADLQSAFQAAVMAGEPQDDAVLALLRDPAQAGRAEAFGVYVDAYRIRANEYLAEDYPATRALLGDERFAQLVEDYVVACPSTERSARWFSSRLPEFMRESDFWGGYLREISVACFERALTDAFDAADAESQAIDTLASWDPQDWPRLVFAFHPSLTLLRLEAGALAAFHAALAGEEPPQATDDSELEAVAVWRSVHEAAYRPLGADEYVALHEACAGRAFGDICQMASFQAQGEMTPERLAQCLAGWFAEGMVISVSAEE